MKRETKIYKKPDGKLPEPSFSEGSFLEICFFAVFFVIVVSVFARTASAADAKASVTTAAAAPSAAPSAAPADSALPIHPIGDSTALPSSALPTANISAALPEPTAKPFGWTSKMTMETSQTLSADESISYGGWYQVATGYTDQNTGLTGGLSVGWFQEYSKVKDNGKNGDLDNPVLTLSKSWAEGTDFKSSIFDSVSVGLAAVAGASYESSAHRTYLGGIGPSVSVSKTIRGKLHLGQALGYARGFYNYDIRNDGTVNSPDVFKSKSDISYDLSDKLALSVSIALSHALSFQHVGKSTSISSASVDYSPTRVLGLSLGVTTQRGTISDDGASNRIALYDANVAQAFLDLVLSF